MFPHLTKKISQIPAKLLNFLNDLAQTIVERFVLAYPSWVVFTDSQISVPAWEESLINLDYLLAWFHPHLKKLQGCTSVNSTESNPDGINGPLKHFIGGSQSEVKLKINGKPSNPPEMSLQTFSPGQLDSLPGSVSASSFTLLLYFKLKALTLDVKITYWILQLNKASGCSPFMLINQKICGLYFISSSSPHWTTSPDLWGQIPSSVHQVDNNLSHFLHLLEDLPRRYLVKSLTCDNLDLFLPDPPPGESHGEDPLVFAPPVENPQPTSWTAPAPRGYSTLCTPWLLSGMAPMGFNSGNSANVDTNNVDSKNVNTIVK
ncbi:hypothetical protein DSO57_1005101 [Entomophthora muscae]|uniref:Uncharacterized protein n=1 Tax=Entomophthora muscae TaxID=34485 RepID=A0ACC2S9W7_9FUNG|nr:hypothetical protein DSO57_1005101 [Entomophthora muscae]